MESSDLVGIFYNSEYLLKITKRYVQLNTNIDTDHKPFYTSVIWREKYEFIIKNDCIMLSENISMLLSSNASKCIFIKLPADQQNEIHLIRRT
ncbi:hypothetical protein BA768_19815 [Chryseobacterium sp. CBo1]|nr:hypothetical protein BA768_19815 [Chryseobacterium sp. CBo1]VXC59684.1 conserved hypothetical protein [Chryseobacterium sp. 8AT]